MVEAIRSNLDDRALREREAQYRAIFDATSDGLLINDAETALVLAANPAACRMHGYPDMVGMHPRQFIHPDDHALFDEYVRVVKAGGEFRTQARDVRADGTVFDVEVLGRGFSYGGRPALLGVVRDITDRVRALQTLDRRVAERTRQVERHREVAEALRELLTCVNSGASLSELLNQVLLQADRLFGSAASAIDVPATGEHEALHAERGQPAASPLFVLPLRVAEDRQGTLSLAYSEQHPASAEDAGLARAFADQASLAIANALLRMEAERRLREQEALFKADETLLRALRLDDVLQALADVAIDMLQADKSMVAIWNESGDRIRVPAARGVTRKTLSTPIPPHEARFMHDLYVLGPPVVAVTLDTFPEGSAWRELYRHERLRSTLAAGIRVGGKVFGAFAVSYVRAHEFSESERRLVLALAQRAALAIDNARLYEQAQQVATLEERQRLARELHDAVTQTLFSSTLIADVLPALYERDVEEGKRHLQQLRRLSRGALAEMRSLLVELRPGALNELPLPDLLKQLADGVQGRTTLDVQVHLSGDPLARLPDPVHVAVYRVAQEALTNVVKHAGAQHAALHLRYRPDGLVLRVEDDGRGFDPRLRSPGHMGLGIMRERAHGIGAHLQVRSRPGHGTRVTLTWRAGLPARAR